MRYAFSRIASVFVVVFALVSMPSASLAVVSTNVDFNKSYFARRSVEGRELDETSLTEEQRQRLERIRTNQRIRSLPQEDILALGEPTGVSKTRAIEPAPRGESAMESEAGAGTFRWRWEYSLLCVLAIGILIVLFKGQGKKK